MSKLFIAGGAAATMLAVILGAFGAHGLRTRLPPELLATWQTAVEYHFYHGLGLILVGILALHLPGSPWLRWSGGSMLAGILLFSGSLYLLSVTGIRWLGAITPIGGVAFILAWLLVFIAALQLKS